MATPTVQPGIQTSPVFPVRGQRSRWRYPHERATPLHCAVLKNMNLSERGSADARNGYAAWTTSSTGAYVTGLTQNTWKTHGLQQVIATPTKVFTDNGSTQKELTGSLSLTAGGNDDRYRFAFLKDTLIACNGKDEIWTWNGNFSSGTAAAALTFDSVTIQTCEDLIEHRGVLLAFGTTEGGTKYPTRIRWCDIDTKVFSPDINNFIENNRYELYEDGPAIVGAVDNFGRVLVFKRDGLYAGIIEYDVGFIEFRLLEQQTIRGFSPIAKSSLIKRPEFVFGVAEEGAFVIRPDLSMQIVTLDIQDEWNSLNQDRLQYAQSYIRESDHQVRTLVSSETCDAGHDLILVWDWESGDVFFDEPTHKLSYGERFNISNVEFDWWGSTSGIVYKANDPSSTSDAGTGTQWRIKTNPNDLGMPGKTKNIIRIRTLYSQRLGQQGGSLTVIRDEGKSSARTKSVSFQNLTWDTGETWDATNSWNTGGANIDNFFVNREAEVIQCEWEGDQPINIVGYQVEFEVVE